MIFVYIFMLKVCKETF